MDINNQRGQNTRKQIYRYIVLYIQSNGYPPTVREIRDGVGLKSPSAVHYQLGILEQQGWIRTGFYKPRAIQVLKTVE